MLSGGLVLAAVLRCGGGGGGAAAVATLARVAAPPTGVAVDTANRRIAFTNLVISSLATTITRNGSLSYPTKVAPENRAACG